MVGAGTTPRMEAASGEPAIEIDESRRPLVVVTFRGTARDDELDAYLETMTRILLRGEPVATVLDATRSGITPPLQRRRQAEWQRQHADLLRRHAIGAAFAINSSAVRGVLNAILWLAPLPHPYHVAATLADAERWAVARLRAAGVALPET